ncbi:dicarboxylate/amino acid:cation symporter [Treponema denticola]|uniref:dicarboxylate/amino acid:cation symporter n=1 Tax=Treponema denticola TaxID=158 RepID=UPI0020A5FD9D|nr:dicarboxylate/amino acid:cation symporter [Treponema denticola]UTC84551.1 dicarboxylate/amino acid:cation symporter [Treponema denticola]
MNKKLVWMIFIAFIIGLVVGIVLWQTGVDVGGYVTWVSPFGNILVSMLKMIVIPVIFLSLISGAASLPTKEFGKIGVKVVIWYFVTSLFAAIVGSFLALAFNPGSGTSHSEWASLMSMGSAEIAPASAGSLADVFLDMFQNPFKALAQGNFLAIIVFAIAFGIALKIISEKNDAKLQEGAKLFLNIVETCKETVFKMVDWILAYSPIGVFCLTSVNFAQYGSKLFGPYIMLTLGVVIGIIAMVFIVYPIMIAVSTRKNPIKIMMQIREPMLTAFVTRSSAASLPVSLRTAKENLHISDNLSSFALPLGSTVNMDGVCVHLPMFAVLAANMFGADIGFTALLVLVITTVLASVGAGGVPGGSLMLLFIILQNMNLDPGQIAIIVGLALGINPILDMFEAMNNVAGDLVCTYCVADMSDMIEKDS